MARGGLGYWPEIAHSHQILDLLYDSPAFSLASQLIGTAHPCRTGQIALRLVFPTFVCRSSLSLSFLLSLSLLYQSFVLFDGQFSDFQEISV